MREMRSLIVYIFYFKLTLNDAKIKEDIDNAKHYSFYLMYAYCT